MAQSLNKKEQINEHHVKAKIVKKVRCDRVLNVPVDASAVSESPSGDWACECRLEERRDATEGVGGGFNTVSAILGGFVAVMLPSFRGLPLGLFAADTPLALECVGEFVWFRSETAKKKMRTYANTEIVS